MQGMQSFFGFVGRTRASSASRRFVFRPAGRRFNRFLSGSGMRFGNGPVSEPGGRSSRGPVRGQGVHAAGHARMQGLSPGAGFCGSGVAGRAGAQFRGRFRDEGVPCWSR